MADKLTELREQLGAKDELLGKVIEEMGPDLDFSKVKAFGDDLDNQAKYEKFNALERELADLSEKCRKEHIRQVGEKRERLHEDLRTPVREVPHSTPTGGTKSIGERIIDSPEFKEFEGDHSRGMALFLEEVEVKTLMSTTAGWAPDSDRTGRVVDAAVRPIQVLDLIPMGDTDSNSVTYWEETLRTISAAEKLEGATYAESASEYTERTSQVRKITDSIPVTDEQLEDRAQVRTLLEQKLGFNLRQRLDSQVLNGDGTPPNLEGIFNTNNIQTQAKGADPTFDAIHKAMTKVRVTGRAIPGAIVLHPTDWEEIRLTRTADGIYILGNPAIAGPMTLFGVQVVLADSFSAGTGLVGDFANYCRLYNRRGLAVEVGYTGTQFVEGKKTIRADIRAAFVVERPQAFCTVTGI